LKEAMASVDKETSSNLAAKVSRDMDRSMLRLERRLSNLEGGALNDATSGANAMWSWAGRQAMNMNTLALLGSQVLSMINDVASLTLFSEISSVPTNIKLLTKAIAPMKNAQKRDLEL